MKEDIRAVYKMGKVIGSGNFGTVRLASQFTNESKIFAIKSIRRERIESEIQLLE